MNDRSLRSALSLVAACSLAAVLAACGGTADDHQAAADQGSVSVSTHSSALTPTRTGGAIQTPFVSMNSTGGTGVHASHPSYACSVCHLVGGAVQFDPSGPAIIAGTLATDSTGKVIKNSSGQVTILVPAQLPTYDPVGGTCSNVACHAVAAGVYVPQDYWPPDAYTYPYGGSTTRTPDWYSVPGTNACSACHGYPPSGNGGVWHSGWHGGVNVNSPLSPDTQGFNACSTCHQYTSTTITGAGTAAGKFVTTFTNPSTHMNGTVDVLYYNPARRQGPIQDTCDGCHFGF